MASKTQTEQIATKLLKSFGLADSGWRFVWDNAKNRGGQCRYHVKQISMSRYLVPMWTEQQVRETLMHELAHALVGPGFGHGPVWRRMMHSLGQNPERCHTNPTVTPPLKAVCPSHGVVAHRHRRTNGALCRRCRTPVVWEDTRQRASA